MKKVAVIAGIILLTGCVTYPVPGTGHAFRPIIDQDKNVVGSAGTISERYDRFEDTESISLKGMVVKTAFHGYGGITFSDISIAAR